MCGVPHHAANGYIEQLIERGYKVALCDQVEDPKLTKGLVKREVVQVITPGTLMSSLTEKENQSPRRRLEQVLTTGDCPG